MGHDTGGWHDGGSENLVTIGQLILCHPSFISGQIFKKRKISRLQLSKQQLKMELLTYNAINNIGKY